MRLQRHDLLDVAPDAWAEAVEELALPADAMQLVAEWSGCGWPVIVRRRLAGESEASVPVALQLPDACGRLRVAVAVPAAAVTRRASVSLAEAFASAPPVWADTVGGLLALGERFETPAVYGSLLWQHVTSEPTLRPGSDLDLLWRPAPQRRRALLEALCRLDHGTVRVDGEIVLEDGGGVSWRELAAAEGWAETVVVKTIDGVALRAVGAILRAEPVPC